MRFFIKERKKLLIRRIGASAEGLERRVVDAVVAVAEQLTLEFAVVPVDGVPARAVAHVDADAGALATGHEAPEPGHGLHHERRVRSEDNGVQPAELRSSSVPHRRRLRWPWRRKPRYRLTLTRIFPSDRALSCQAPVGTSNRALQRATAR